MAVLFLATAATVAVVRVCVCVCVHVLCASTPVVVVRRLRVPQSREGTAPQKQQQASDVSVVSRYVHDQECEANSMCQGGASVKWNGPGASRRRRMLAGP